MQPLQTLQTKTLDNFEQLTKQIEDRAKRQQKAEEEKEKITAAQKDALDEFSNSVVTLVPSPNFSDATPVGTCLPINMADETVTYLSQLNRKFDFIDFVKDKLAYNSKVRVTQSFASEQLDALVMAITQFEKNNAFILGDMAGIGKGRVCAGVMRYAYQRGLIPIFVTHKPYLFSDIYRDFSDIQGLGVDQNGKKIEINPLVMHEDGLVYATDSYGEPLLDLVTGEKIVAFSGFKPKQLNKMLTEETAKIYQKIDQSGKDGNPVYTGQDYLPNGYNAIFLPYSTIGQAKDNIKQEFLEALAFKSIIVFDESHNAASANTESVILKRCTPLVNAAEGVLFSSATYAKSPAVFNLYVIKTALRTAVPTLESITNALKVGGENVSEYIASGLVKEGQMIRRERSFSSCKKVTEYVGTIRTEIAGKVIHTNDPKDKQKEFFNEAISYFKELRDFSITPDAKLAIKLGIERQCAAKNYELVDQKDFLDFKYYIKYANEPDPVKQAAKLDWVQKHKGKYILKYKEDSIVKYKQTFRENLFLSIKAKFAADLIIDCLNREEKYTNFNGDTYYAPLKPLIAMKSTGTAIFNDLGLNLGDTIKNDFSEYLLAIYNKLFAGTFEVREVVDVDIFLTETDVIRTGVKPQEAKKKLGVIVENYSILIDDFFDNPTGLDGEGKITPRQIIIKIQNRLNAYNSDIPFSVIDYLRYRIESTPRSPIYFQPGTFDPKYAEASSPYYKFLEATGRDVMLEKMDLKDPNSLYVFRKNDRIPDITDVYKAFNSGNGDVMLINVVASTGGSAQSSIKFKDKRPRNMFIIQTELDINTEVQKRGRINRTGQVNSPTYTYVVTQIPVEQRLYLMFRKKLRKLDANTSANQAASVEASEINDKDGEPIEDIFNPYGFDVFVESFVNVPANNKYKLIYDSLGKKGKASGAILASQAKPQTTAQSYTGQQGQVPTGTNQANQVVSKNIAGGQQDEENYEAFNAFVRELELYPVDNIYDASGNVLVVGQKPFFDEMQMLYKNYVRELKQKGEYQLELIAREYKASLRQSTLIQENAGTSVFSSSLFLSDYFTLNDRFIWSRDRVWQKIADIAKKQDPKENHLKLIADFERESKINMALERKIYEDLNNPIKQKILSDLDKDSGDIEIITKKQIGDKILRYGDKFKVVKPNHTSYGETFIFSGFGNLNEILVIDENADYNSPEYTRFNTDLAKYANDQQSDNDKYLRMIKYFTPGKPIMFDGNVGIFLGVILKDAKGGYKYAPALVDFMFAFLSGYTTLRFNLTGLQFNQLGIIKSDTQFYIERDVQAPTSLGGTFTDEEKAKVQENQDRLLQKAEEYKRQVTAWKPDPWLRMVKRFYTGNILSAIVLANEKKAKNGPNWTLTRFTNIDGSYTTAVQLSVSSKILETLMQYPELMPLSVSAGSIRFVKYLQEMPVSTSDNSSVTIVDPNRPYTLPIWNLPSPKLINAKGNAEIYNQRAISIVKTQEEKKGIYYPIVNFSILQNYEMDKDKNIVYIKPIQRASGKIDYPQRWNPLYHDDTFLEKFNDYLSKQTVTIKYGMIEVPNTDKKGKVIAGPGQKKLINYGCLEKKLSFNLLDANHLIDLQEFLNRLAAEYQVSFEFRSSAASYLNTGKPFIDVEEARLKSEAPDQKFEKGEYLYQFIKKMPEELVIQIPYVLEKRLGGEYGQVLTSLPLTPTQCRTFELIPLKIDNSVYVKMALSVLDDINKNIFIKELEEKSKTETIDKIGIFVQKFILENSIPTKYFFGDLDAFDIGAIFKNYILNEDISKLVLKEESVKKITEIPKDKVTFEDAERFLMFLNP